MGHLLRPSLLQADHLLAGSLNCANSPIVTSAVALSTSMKSFNSTPQKIEWLLLSAKLFAFITWSHSPSGSQYAGKTTCSSPCRHSATPPLTHSCISSFSVIGGHPPREVLHWEQLAVLADTSERNCSSFRLTNHMSRKSVLLHVILFTITLRTSSSSNTWLQLSPIALVVHCGKLFLLQLAVFT